MTHPEEAHYGCGRCGSELGIVKAGYEENLDGGPSAWTVDLECADCQERSVARWLMRLVPGAAGIACEPRLIQLSALGDGPDPVLLTDTRRS
jgi:hypothetical protein